jgi:hypothetical protein
MWTFQYRGTAKKQEDGHDQAIEQHNRDIDVFICNHCDTEITISGSSTYLNMHACMHACLEVDYVQLKLVTKNFTRESTRLNCIKGNKLNICETMVNSKVFFVYFPLLKPCFLY